MSTTRQIAANRRNARKSTGPKTAAGKDRAKGNALKHGLTAAQITVFDECPEDFESLYSGLLAALIPSGALEEQLVERIAVCAWRLRRVYRIEAWLIGNPSSDAIQASKALTPEPELNYDLSRLTIDQLASLNALSETISDPRAGAALVRAQTATSAEVQAAPSGEVQAATPAEVQAATPAEAQAATPAEAQAATPAEAQAVTPAEAQAATPAEAQAATPAEAQAATPAEAQAATPAEAQAAIPPEARAERASSVEAPRAYRRPTSIGNVFMGLTTSHGPFIQLSRHETTIERSYHRALHDLERLQARRKGEAVIAPVALDVSSDG
jgi:chemotaxis protein histidine kinase CheA